MAVELECRTAPPRGKRDTRHFAEKSVCLGLAVSGQMRCSPQAFRSVPGQLHSRRQISMVKRVRRAAQLSPWSSSTQATILPSHPGMRSSSWKTCKRAEEEMAVRNRSACAIRDQSQMGCSTSPKDVSGRIKSWDGEGLPVQIPAPEQVDPSSNLSQLGSLGQTSSLPSLSPKDFQRFGHW